MTEPQDTPAEVPFEERLKLSLSNAYDIERELGGGGMSRVFVATDRILGRKIVIKLLSPELIESVNRARFRREIQVAAQLQHPHIVTLLSAGEDGDIVYYTMPFIEGESLKSAVEQKGPQGVRDTIRVLYDVTDALSYAHARGVVHRDIKPANILRSGNHALVTDFGVAKALNAAMSSSPMTSTGMAIGTPAYMAPEQLAGDPSADHRIDIYALGLLAYELLAGKSPFWAATPQAQMAALLTLDPKPLHELRKDVPKRLSMVIMQCLEKDPEDRPPTAEALMTLLDGVATTSGEIRTREHKVPSGKIPIAKAPQKEKKQPTKQTAAVPVPVPFMVDNVDQSPTYEETPEKSRRGLLIGALAVLLLAATGAGAMLFSKRGESKGAAGSGAQNAAGAPGQGTALATAAGGPGGAGGVGGVGGVGGAAGAAPVAPPVMTKVDSQVIAEAVRKALASAAATKAPGQTTINTDSLRRVAQQRATDSITRVKQAELASAAAAAAAAAPAPAPAAAAAAPSSDKPRVAIADARENSEQPELNAFSRAIVDGLRNALDKKNAYGLVDQDEVRGVLARTKSRDEAAGIIQPDAMVTVGFIGSGEQVTVSVAVRDTRAGSSFGVRVTSARVFAKNPEYYVPKIVESVVGQLEALSRAPIYKPRR